MKLSVVMATMNEAKSIECMIEEIRRYSPGETEILIVDSSKDETREIAQRLGAKVIFQEPQGHGLALKTALHAASGDVIISADCDMTYPMDRLPDFLRLISEEGYDLVSGCRMTKELKKEMPLSNRLANFFFAAIVRFLYGIDTHDVSTGMFAMIREYAQIDWKGNFSLPAEIIVRSKLLNKRYLEVPIKYELRIGETTLNKWRSGKAYLKSFFYWKYGWFAGAEL